MTDPGNPSIGSPGPDEVKRHLQVIVVEDNEIDAELVSRYLTRAGLLFSIRRVDNERDFVNALQAQTPDLILSDFSLPKFNGLRALEVAIIQAPDVPFIYVSGTIGEERAIEAVRRGATDYVLKSNLARLYPAVERALREASLRADKRRSELLRREQEVRLQRLTRTYRMLSSTGSAILRQRNRTDLFDEVCRIAVNQGGYERVSISLLEVDGRILNPRASAASTADAANDAAPAFAKSQSLIERAIRSRTPAVLNELAPDPRRADDTEAMAQHRYQAAAAVPLLVDGTAVGALTLFSSQPRVFDDAEVGVLLELTANLGYALQYLAKDEAVHFLSYFDSLTGLAKRSFFCQRLNNQLESQIPRDAGRMVVVFDVQKLGAINDSLGRYVGDHLLEAIAARLKHAYGDVENIAYFGGGTFAVTLAVVGPETDTGRLPQNAIAELFVEPFDLGGQEMRPVIRAGIAVYPHDGTTAETLVQNAEAALKAARQDSEKYMLYGLMTRRPTPRSLALEGRLADALARDEFQLHYQPKVDIETGVLDGFEALLRWRDSVDGLVSPAVFVPMLEHSGAIIDVGEWVIQQALRDIRDWCATGLAPVRVAVNVSAMQLRQRDFVDRILANVESAEKYAAGIDIEITESMLMQDMQLSVRKLEQLREAGIGVAIDDFGTGYSSLCVLATLPVDILKIDRSFVQTLGESQNGLTLVSTIVSLASAFNMRTVAEGVETAEQLSLLRSVKCDVAQGYYLGRPTPAADVPSVIGYLTSRATPRAALANEKLHFLQPLTKQFHSS